MKEAEYEKLSSTSRSIDPMDPDGAPNNYENIIQKLEAEVRNHISVQQQLKLYIESYQQKLEDEEGAVDEIESRYSNLEAQLSEKETE